MIPEFLQRLKTEIDDLDAKIQKLDEFFDTELFKTLPDLEQSLMHMQHNAMLGYIHSLEARAKLIGARLEKGLDL